MSIISLLTMTYLLTCTQLTPYCHGQMADGGQRQIYI